MIVLQKLSATCPAESNPVLGATVSSSKRKQLLFFYCDHDKHPKENKKDLGPGKENQVIWLNQKSMKVQLERVSVSDTQPKSFVAMSVE